MPETNHLLDSQLSEAAEVATFVNSAGWLWFKKRLETLRPRLVATASMPGVNRDDRMIALGQLSFVESILNRPDMLAEILRNFQNRSDTPPTFAHPAVVPSFNPGIL